MAEAVKAQEPSMEEILASIRRIIADDDTKPSPSAAPAPPAPMPPQAAPPAPPPRQAAPPPPPVAAPPELSMQAAVDAVLANDVAPEEPNAFSNEAEDVLDLTESMVAPEPPPTEGFQTIDSEPDVIFAEAAPVLEDTLVREAPEPAPQSEFERRLLSNSASAAVDSAFNTLAHTVLVQNARTLEDLVREMLRPLLKGWLDDNLPEIVERLVKTEIERVSRGRG